MPEVKPRPPKMPVQPDGTIKTVWQSDSAATAPAPDPRKPAALKIHDAAGGIEPAAPGHTLWRLRVCREVQERGGIRVSLKEVRAALTRFGVTPGEAHRHVLAAWKGGFLHCPNPDDTDRRLTLRGAGRRVLRSDDRADLVRRLHAEIEAGDRDTLRKARRAGEELLAEREACIREQRGWYEWLKKAGVHPRTANRYMDVAKGYRDGILSDSESGLGYSEALIRVRAALRGWDDADRTAEGTGDPDIPEDGTADDDPPEPCPARPLDPKHLRRFSIILTLAVFDELKRRLAWLTTRHKITEAEAVVRAVRHWDEEARRG
jgi:hypothetical protein